MKYPEDLRKHIYTTNAVESVTSIYWKNKNNLGAYFQTVEVLETNIYSQKENLHRVKVKMEYLLLKNVVTIYCSSTICAIDVETQYFDKSLQFHWILRYIFLITCYLHYAFSKHIWKFLYLCYNIYQLFCSLIWSVFLLVFLFSPHYFISFFLFYQEEGAIFLSQIL